MSEKKRYVRFHGTTEGDNLSTSAWSVVLSQTYGLKPADEERLFQLVIEKTPQSLLRLSAIDQRNQAIRACRDVHFAALPSISQQAAAIHKAMKRFSAVRSKPAPGSLAADIVAILKMTAGKPLAKRTLIAILAGKR
jgi:hypothetical protein